MSANHETYLDLAAGYALGSLDDGDRILFEDHLGSGCAECEAALADFSEATVMLAGSAPAMAPPPELRARVIKAALAARPGFSGERKVMPFREPKRRSGFNWNWGWAAAAAVLAVVAGIGWMTSARLRSEVTRLGDELRTAHERIAVLENEAVEENRWARVPLSPGTRVAVLKSTPDAVTKLQGRAVYDPSTHAAVVVLQNIDVPSGRDYELWAIRGGKPASLGLIHPDKDGVAVLRIEDAGDPKSLGAFAVSLEPQGGSPNPSAPSGPVVMLGKLGG